MIVGLSIGIILTKEKEMIATKNQIPSLAYDDDPDTQALLEDEEYNQHKNEVFLYLEKLREDGLTNMFGAGSFIMADFEVSKSVAHKYLAEWMESYKGKDNDK
tara:strand:- start:6591 stop:6899 length:309 start_codon:yes stop_codon:yes gene_type:complete